MDCLPSVESSSTALEEEQQQQQLCAFRETRVHNDLILDQGQRSTNTMMDSDTPHPVNCDELPMHLAESYSSNSMMCNEAPDPFLGVEGGFDDILMGNFLHGIINTDQSNNQFPSHSTGGLPNVLHFGFNEFADSLSSGFDRVHSPLAPMRTATTEDKNLSIGSRGGMETPAVRRAVHAGEQAFRESIWLWDPSIEDSSVSEQIHLTLPRDHSIAEHQSREVDSGLRLSATSRDRLLSMILRTCEPQVQRQVVSCFPSTEFLSCLLADFKIRHVRQISPWIHFPTLNLDDECEEFLAALICAGAADSRRPEIRKLGFALQEAARLAIMKRFEEDNRNLRDLRSIQALLLILQVGLNSASRRKIEIAESFTLIVVTMLRRGGRFWSKRDSLLVLNDNDDNRRQTLEVHWKRWVEEESFKRLVYHVLFQDVQTSSALFRQPVVSYFEINLTMPCSAEMWQAESAEIWRQEILTRQRPPNLSPLTLQNCLQDPGLLSLHHGHIDLQMSLRVMVSIFWSRVWQFIQMRAISLPLNSNPNLVTVNYFRQQLVATSQDLIVRFSEDFESMHPCVKMVLELGLMHLYVSLEDIQHLAGKEGEEQARKAASRLRSWIGLPESRHALFHAGQIAKAAVQCPLQYLRGYHAVVIYHASLTMWAYALLATSQTSVQTAQVGNFHGAENKLPLVRLDGDETPELRRFILLGNGTACIRRYPPDEPRMVPLTDSAEVMMSMAGLLSSRDESEYYCIPIVSYLTSLMHSLAKASAGMKLLR
ncbi:uncharacterized protein Z518_00264 [Rhinocladiella mackenziei CBS 650.93]|uniref:Rhinocladiella mackenziei CBS 650.93 unplaced genomic scaffold supercont1.1, whole genome shotgun sequence n=1 Tax=Rhinocladiella mackenziei CBS 650.93 TaxID=1442369 RepID=A0A0D2JIE1_9EURO|nr:uncharacterized protein Z518_00264 [Rhinocladiella mackenziei CBS 650.93]KIX09185.1 hypothetical protein Z518_00264 [Rhinocladiella mackenziei CBS 650.93]